MAKLIDIEIDQKTGQISVETSGFAGKGCDAVHAAFAGGNDVISNDKKPEYKVEQARQAFK